ncbi:L,D-transpeptidase family protein [Flavobacterium sp. CBA20B-1]|uniref:L,D-transpeptidase family protein n=1 Tax=unclassified Flavobacterium TaxID=196869 RepID=UPI0022245024|nr:MULTISPECIES: L,D-transpeptidase family protein [unclassified Flavobacterium]WCM42119.1 L,D-transpeptidase family protein [Flavobacterium sp. CBA20B-1]
MNWKKIIIGALVFSACTTNQNNLGLTNAEKTYKIEKTLFFGKDNNMVDFYTKNDFETIWKDSINRSQLISAIIDSRYDAVLPEKYPLAQLIKAHNNYNNLSIAEVKKADIHFTETFFRIAKQLSTGKINPKKMYGDWEPYHPEIDYKEILKESLENNSIYDGLEEIKPKNKLYLSYKKAFAKYVPITSKDTLSEEGLLRKKVWVNFERTKWIQPDLGDHYVWVNLPEYQLHLIENGAIVDTHKVIIGKKSRRTPVLSSTFNSIIMNPKWTVPPTILKNDLVPKASANLGYFASNRMRIIDKKTGKQVAPENWNAGNYNAYRYVQESGSSNSLGQIKFNFPNKHMVYLHDTNNRTRFVEKYRALSSGCVRVEDPFRLAEKIFKIEGRNISKAEMDTLAVEAKTKNFSLNKKVNVHQVYLTAVINDAGEIQILNDVYSLDNKLYKQLIQ